MKFFYLVLIVFWGALSTPVLANENAFHDLFDRLEGDLDILKLPELMKELRPLTGTKENLAKFIKQNPGALTKLNSHKQLPIMRASQLGLARLVAEMSQYKTVQKKLKAIDDRGLSIADQATTAQALTYKVCNPKLGVGSIPAVSLVYNSETLAKNYQFLVETLVKVKIPSNPRKVAKVWLEECPNAAPETRKKIKELGAKNSSKSILDYLLKQAGEGEKSKKVEKAKKNRDFSKSLISREEKKQLDAAEGVYIGPLKLADNPEGDGVLIAGVIGPVDFYRIDYELKGLTQQPIAIHPDIGQKVVNISGHKISDLKSVKEVVKKARDSGLMALYLTVILPHARDKEKRFSYKAMPIKKGAPPLEKLALDGESEKQYLFTMDDDEKKFIDSSMPVLSDELKSHLKSAQTIQLGALHLAAGLDGKGVFIAKIDVDLAKKAKLSKLEKSQRLLLMTGQQVHAIDGKEISTLDDAEKVLKSQRERGFRQVTMKVSTNSEAYRGQIFDFQTIPYDNYVND